MTARIRALALPLLVAVPVAVGSVILWDAHDRRARDTLSRLVDGIAREEAAEIESRVSASIGALSRMGERWERRGRVDESVWEAGASTYLADDVVNRALGWIDASGTPRRAVGDLDADALAGALPVADLLAGARGADEPFVTPARLPGGGAGHAIVVPLRAGGASDGILVGAFRADALLAGSVGSVEPGYGVAVFEGGDTIFTRGAPLPAGEDVITAAATVALSGGSAWTVRAWPGEGLLLPGRYLPEIGLVAGLAIALLLGLVVHFGRAAVRRSRELEERRREALAMAERAEGARRRATAAEERLRVTVRELERSNDDLERFAYVASHDLQEPLRMVASYAQLLERRYRDELDDDAGDFIDHVVDGARRMRTLINDLLAYSRVGTRGKPFAPVDIDAVVDDALANLETVVEETGAEIAREGLPRITADRSQVAQLFQNLIHNAVRFHGDEPPRVRIGAEREDGGWRFTVSDEGIGIDPGQADRIFTIFQRLHTRGEYEGTGIGLALCKRIVERHGGRIGVDSSPGDGATFHFTIPDREPDDAGSGDGNRDDEETTS